MARRTWRLGIAAAAALAMAACGGAAGTGLAPGAGSGGGASTAAIPNEVIVVGSGPERGAGSFADRDVDIWLFSPDGSFQQDVAPGPWYDNDPSFFDNGNQIVFSTYRNGRLEIFTMNYDGATPQPVNVKLAGGKTRPEISPDGRWLVFEVSHKVNGVSNLDLGVHDMVTGKAWYITSDPAQERDPTWCGNSRLAFTHGEGNIKGGEDLDIYVATFNPGAPPSLGPWQNISDMPTGDNADHDPACDDSGTKVTWHSHRYRDKVFPRFTAGEIVWASVASPGEVRRVTWADGNDARPAWSPDGNRVAFTTRRDLVTDSDGNVTHQGPWVLAVINAQNDGTQESGFYEPCCPKLKETQRKDWAVRP